MATPTIDEIKQEILAKKAEFSSLDELDSTSKVALYNLWAYVVAASIWVLYQFHDTYTQETDQKIAEQKLFTLDWFREATLSFRYGHPLVASGAQLVYSDDGYTDEEIEDAQIIKRASVENKELDGRRFVFIKAASEDSDGNLQKLTDDQKNSLIDYWNRLSPAGTKFQVFSDDPDKLRLTMDFYYDPLVLTETGGRIDGANNQPVQDALRAYLKNLPFNGEFSIAELVDALQEVEGCSEREVSVKQAEHSFTNPVNYVAIEDFAIANSGYMEISDSDLTINFIPKTVQA
ncbi:hypothetical protein [Flagellimonas eckloniae]|uniref:Nucleotidyltransferase n=1 Tax=Flagellimonas eckloniae TaxID=346185 RepID=A0A0Q1H926_9FLAO|nr:hypothetical protein [Allomuricauda eckloniae]KQC30165.1 hypothetical protein AAY42_09965 [Allomuricauda eckloniae]